MKRMRNVIFFDRYNPEETANVVTHGLGFLLGTAATGLIMTRLGHSSLLCIVPCIVYSATLLLTYAVSTLSHAVREPAWRRWFRTADEACIFFLIAGSATPFLILYLPQSRWWPLTFAMWVFAFAGAGRAIYVGDLSRRDKLAYGALGLLPIVSFGELWRHASPMLVVWLIAGGICYSAGTILLRFPRLFPFSHAGWHVCVLVGSACHYWALLMALSQTPLVAFAVSETGGR